MIKTKLKKKRYKQIKKTRPYKVINNYYSTYNNKEPWHMNKEEWRLIWTIICFTFIFLLCKLIGNAWPLLILVFWLMILVG